MIKIGYTHYYEIKKKSKIKDLSGCLKNIKTILEQYQDIINLKGDDKPKVTKNLIMFNGIREDGHETFHFEFPSTRNGLFKKYNSDENGFAFYFCKTARKPYDIAVTKCLLILKEYLKDDMKLSSDGDFSNQEEWGQAIKDVQDMGINIIPHIVVEKL